jgi:hypothetical protein
MLEERTGDVRDIRRVISDAQSQVQKNEEGKVVIVVVCFVRCIGGGVNKVSQFRVPLMWYINRLASGVFCRSLSSTALHIADYLKAIRWGCVVFILLEELCLRKYSSNILRNLQSLGFLKRLAERAF